MANQIRCLNALSHETKLWAIWDQLTEQWAANKTDTQNHNMLFFCLSFFFFNKISHVYVILRLINLQFHADHDWKNKQNKTQFSRLYSLLLTDLFSASFFHPPASPLHPNFSEPDEHGIFVLTCNIRIKTVLFFWKFCVNGQL